MTYPSVHAYCSRRLPSHQVDDAVAEIYTVAWNRHEVFLGADIPLAWLYGVAFRVVSSEYRKAKRRRLLTERLSAEPHPYVQPPHEGVESSTRLHLAFQALQSLSIDDQELLALAVFEELTYSEIAAVKGSTEASARSALYRARRRLRDAYGELEGGDA